MVLTKNRISSYALILNEDRILLSKLNRGPNKGKWNLIGGGIHHGEDPIDALKREVYEESRIVVAEDFSLLSVLSDRYIYINSDGCKEDLHLIGVIYLIQLKSHVECKIDGDGDSSDGCQWFSVQELKLIDTVSFVEKALNLLKIMR
jgi:8-oxo-dGTP pyrophosphatase MutT (NUDIX family)